MKTNFFTSPLTLLAAALLAAGTGCQRHAFSGPTPPAVSAVDLAARTVRFGHGSAYTGFRTCYTLQADGALLVHAGLGARSSTSAAPDVLRIPLNQVRALFRRFDTLPADSTQFEQPGQHYYFLEGTTETGAPVYVAWGAPDTIAPHCARALYQQLTGLVPANM